MVAGKLLGAIGGVCEVYWNWIWIKEPEETCFVWMSSIVLTFFLGGGRTLNRCCRRNGTRSTQNMEPWIECAVNPADHKSHFTFAAFGIQLCRHCSTSRKLGKGAAVSRGRFFIGPVNLPSCAVPGCVWSPTPLMSRMVTTRRVLFLYGTGWCAIEMCRDFWWCLETKVSSPRMEEWYFLLNIHPYNFIVNSMRCTTGWVSLELVEWQQWQIQLRLCCQSWKAVIGSSLGTTSIAMDAEHQDRIPCDLIFWYPWYTMIYHPGLQ